MGMRIQQIRAQTNYPPNHFEFGKWYDLIFLDIESSEKRIFQIRRIPLNITDQEEMNPDSVMAELFRYYEKIQTDSRSIENHVCKKGCSCCTNDFPISIIEFFAILGYIGIQYTDDFILEMEKKAKISLHAPQCIFVDDTDHSCKIYEVRPLICRKYGTYEFYTHCPKLKGNANLSPKHIDTSANTLCFESNVLPEKKIMLPPKNLVNWFAGLKNGKLRTQRLRDSYDASYHMKIDDFIQIFLLQ